ncbi:MAG: hypothetical protein IAF58_21540 [Leptolyngbya sp.]|nr:hypothetical protein [Candidatus Melainabacteria bacterium]
MVANTILTSTIWRRRTQSYGVVVPVVDVSVAVVVVVAAASGVAVVVVVLVASGVAVVDVVLVVDAVSVDAPPHADREATRPRLATAKAIVLEFIKLNRLLFAD